MTPRPKASFQKTVTVALRISEEMASQLRGLQERDGIPVSEQIRRGIRLWLKAKGKKGGDGKVRGKA
jgi:hypothetical protein